jgi:ribosomal protein S27AE
MPKSIYIDYLIEQPSSNHHYLNRLIKILNHFISIEPSKKPKGFEKHHIVPKSWKPEWIKEPDNLLKVPAKAHYVIHHLLWKAFPKNYSMVKAFKEMSHRHQKQRITIKVFDILRNEFSDAQRAKARKRVADGTHPWVGPENNNRRIDNGTHPFLGGELNRKRVADGTHNFLDGSIARKSNAVRITNGTHNFLDGKITRKQIEDGKHPSQIKKTCPHCGKSISSGMFQRWHGNRCKSKSVLAISIP